MNENMEPVTFSFSIEIPTWMTAKLDAADFRWQEVMTDAAKEKLVDMLKQSFHAH